MVRSSLLIERPSIIVASIGGATGGILAAAIVQLAPAAGAPYLELARLVGGLFTAAPDAAFHLGFWILFALGWLVLPAALALAWRALPGRALSLVGAAVRGALLGLALWAVAGLILPALGGLGRVPGLDDPGFFALGAGIGGTLSLLVICLAYGLATALIAIMGRGLSPLDSLGWQSRGAGYAA